MSQFFTTEKARFGELKFITFKSPSLNQRANCTVFKPKGPIENIPVVILLHGVYGSHWAWALKGKVHEKLKAGIEDGTLPPMLLAMPSDGLFGDGSGYLEHHEANFEKYIAEEIPMLLKENFKHVTDDSPFFITGLSMGGYGALRIGAKYPKVFKAFSGLSSIINFSELSDFLEDYDTLKDSVKHPENVKDILLANKEILNPFRFDCGRSDSLFQSNRELHNSLKKAEILHEFHEYEGGHEWPYWQQNIYHSLKFFALFI